MSAGDHLRRAVEEIEAHVADLGWDRPSSLFALVETGELLAEQPELAEALGLDDSASGLTPIEQEGLAPGEVLEEVLATIIWPPAVVGAAAVVERLVLPPATDGQIPDDPEEAERFAREHPDREEVRIVAGVTRDGAAYCALRLRSHDEPESVVVGEDLVPNLVAALRATLQDDEEGSA